MTNNQPIDLETSATGTPDVTGRVIENPDNNTNNQVIPVQIDKEPVNTLNELPGLEEKLKYVPENLRGRVRKLTREDIAGAGMPTDREAYNAFIYAEKMTREANRRKNRHNETGNRTPDSIDV